MGILWALSIRKRLPPRGCSEMAAYSVQRARDEGETHRLRADLCQSRIHHAHGKAEHCDFGGGIPQTMQFKTGNGRKQACNHKEDQAVGITQFGLTKEVPKETTRDEKQNGYSGGQGGIEILLSTPEAGSSRVS